MPQDKLWLSAGRSIFGSHEVPTESTASGSSARRQASIMKWHSASELLPLTDFPAEPISAEAFHPAVCKVVPSERAVRRPPDGPHRGLACASPRCRSMPVSSVHVQAVHPDVGWIPLPPRCHEDQKGLTAYWRSGL